MIFIGEAKTVANFEARGRSPLVGSRYKILINPLYKAKISIPHAASSSSAAKSSPYWTNIVSLTN